MNCTLETTRITVHEIVRMRTFQILAATIILLPLVAIVFSNIFIFDIGKVRIDVLVAGSRLLATTYILFIAVTLMGRDIGQKTCYQFLMPPISRHAYLTGRFTGLLLCLLLLMILSMVSGELLISITFSETAEIYRRGLSHGTGLSMAFLIFFQHISLLAMVLMICSWATGLAEMLIFSLAGIFLSWILPPIIQALQTEEVIQHVPPIVAAFTNIIGSILPQLNGGDIALALAHGLSMNTSDIIWHLVEHSSYALIMFAMALIIFFRRDL